MRKCTLSVIFLVFSFPLFCRGADAAPATTPTKLYVALDGNDAWSGSLAEANAAKSDGPLATLEGARNKIRAIKQQGPLPKNGITVIVRGGTYYLRRTFQLGAVDSGTKESPIVYRGAEGEQVQLIGGRGITGFTPYKGEILKADVAAQGFKGVYFRQLFFDGKRQHLARYPNFDPQNPYGGGWAYVDGKMVPMYDNIPGENKHTLKYKASDARSWSRPQEAEVFIFPRFNWWNNILPVAKLDAGRRTITLGADASYPIRAGDRYYVQNVFEELDAPGEWYLDRKSQTLYFWPPAPLEGKSVYAPSLRTLIKAGQRTAYVMIRGMVMECCDGQAVVLDGANNCLIAGNTIRNSGDYNGSGVEVKGGQHNGVVGNDISEVGADAITLSGGDRITLTPANNYADNNYIHHTGVYFKQGVGVNITGVGNRASHNLIHDCPRFGIIFMNDNNVVVEYNHVRHVNLETEDTGAIYTGGRDWISSVGSVIRYNYFHDSLGYGHDEQGKWVSPHFARGAYLDDNAGGVDIIGNIVVRSLRGPIMLHNGRDNRIENNIFVDGGLYQVEYLGWTFDHDGWNKSLPQMVSAYERVAHQPAWQSMRNIKTGPKNALLPDGTIMSGNALERNIFYYHKPEAQLFNLHSVSVSHNPSDYNLVYHFGLPLQIKLSMDKSVAKADPSGSRDTPMDQWPKWWQALGQDQHSIVADPLFVDADKDDYRLKPESPAFKLGFKPIPVEKIGPYADPLRASWPIVEAEGAREKPLQP